MIKIFSKINNTGKTHKEFREKPTMDCVQHFTVPMALVALRSAARLNSCNSTIATTLDILRKQSAEQGIYP